MARRVSAGVRRRCEQRLALLGLPAAADLKQIVTAVEELAGCPISLEARDIPAETAMTGFTVFEPQLGLHRVIYHRLASVFVQRWIICHELGHIALEHGSGSCAAPPQPLTPQLLDRIARQCPWISLDSLASLQARDGRTSRQEDEAETIAGLLMHRIQRAAEAAAQPDGVPRLLDAALASAPPRRTRSLRWRGSRHS
jgi:hypothetical protein